VINAASRTKEALTYSFNGGSSTPSNTFQVTSSLSTSLQMTISTSSGKSLTLDPINFIWQNVALTAAQSSFHNGQKGGIVELFGWPWVDVGKECAFLGRAGFMGVKIWPPNEHVWGSNYVSSVVFPPWPRLHALVRTRQSISTLVSRLPTRVISSSFPQRYS
jgi:alpha-amylase